MTSRWSEILKEFCAWRAASAAAFSPLVLAFAAAALIVAAGDARAAASGAATAKPGDCDGNGQVSISEVQSAIQMFLGAKPRLACVDLDDSGGVGIAEVQKAANAFLGGATGIATTSEAAKAALVVINSANMAYSAGTTVAGFYGMSSGSKTHKAVALPASEPDSEGGAAVLKRVSARILPKTVGAGVSETIDCSGGGSITIESSSLSGTAVFAACREDAWVSTGDFSWTVAAADSTYAIGSASSPFIETLYDSSAGSTKVKETSIYATMSGVREGLGSLTLEAAGSVIVENFSDKTKDEYVLSGLSISQTTSLSAGTVVVAATGGIADTHYKKTTAQYIKVYTSTISFDNFVVTYNLGQQSMGVSGSVAVSTTPSSCMDGTLVVSTTTPVKIDAGSKSITAGEIIVNGSTISFNGDGTVSVATEGATVVYSSVSEFSGSCSDIAIF